MIHLALDQSLEKLTGALSSLSYGNHPTQLNNVVLPKLPAVNDLVKGNIEIDSKDIETDTKGRATVHGHLVFVYIKDQGGYYPEVINGNLKVGKKIHLKRCGVVLRREAEGGGDRYHAIIRDDGFFPVYHQKYMAIESSKLARRRICKVCLSELGINFVKKQGESTIDTFNFEAYLNGELNEDKLFGINFDQPNFAKYPDVDNLDNKEPFRTVTINKNYKKNSNEENKRQSDDNLHTPSKNQEFDSTDNVVELERWNDISHLLRDRALWRCSGCSIYLGDNKGLLHVHHKNGNKSDNREGNLSVLCKECHSKQPNHAHLKPSQEEQKVLDDLRLEKSAWPLNEDDLICFLQERFPNLDIENTEYDLNGEVVIDAIALDYSEKIAICYNHNFYVKDRLNDWKIIEIDRLISLNDLQQKIDLYLG